MNRREILRRLPDGDYDYDGDEEIEERDEDWDLFNESFNW